MPHRRTLLTATGLMLLGMGSTAIGQTASAVPAEVAEAVAGAQALGSARMRFFGLAIYDARLWVAPRFVAEQYAQHPLALELTYLRALGGRAIAQRSLQEMRLSGAMDAGQETRWLVAMESLFPDVAAGDRITGAHAPELGARFWRNGRVLGAIDDPEFSRRFFGIWLASTSSAPELRAALLTRTAS